MLKLHSYITSNYIYDYLKNFKGIIIVPGPDAADQAREFLPSGNIQSIANFFRRYTPEIQQVRKSELMFFLAMAWKKLVNNNFVDFKNYYKYFTEIRNNTPSFEIFDEVISGFEEPFQNFLRTSYKLISELDFYDEFRIYEYLLNSKLKIKEKEIFFLNFKYFNSIQVDFINELSSQFKVEISLPQTVLENSSEYTWPKWLKTDEVRSQSLDQLNGLAKINFYSKVEIGRVNVDKFKYIYLTELDESIHSKLNSSSYYSKMSTNYFEHSFKNISEFINKQIGKKIEYVLSELRKKSESLVEKKKYKDLKLYLSLKAYIEKIYSQSKSPLEKFEVELVKEILKLDLPRLNLVSFSEERSVLSFDPFHHTNEKSAVFLSSMLKLKSYSPETLPKEASMALNALGFFSKDEMERNFFKASVLGYLNTSETEIFVAQECKPGFLNILEEWNMERTHIDQLHFPKKKFIVDPIKKLEEKKKRKFSASSLQRYINCPRSYHLSYNYSVLTPHLDLHSLKPIEEGRYVHEFIETYFLENPPEVEIWLDNLIKGRIDKEKDLYFFREQESYFKLKKSTLNGIHAIKGIKNSFEFETIEFEKKIEDLTFISFVDFYGEAEKGLKFVLDFKRGKFSIPSQKDIFDLRKIQILFYLKRLGIVENFIFGYICLDDLDASLLFSDQDVELDFGKLIKVKDINGLMNNYHQLENDTIYSIETCEDFIAKPIKPTECQFCEVNYLCQKN